MKVAIKIFRVILVALVFIAVGLPAISYVMLSTDWAQGRLRHAGEEALTRLLGTDVVINEFRFRPFSRIDIYGISVNDDNGAEALRIDNVQARVEMGDFILSQKMIIDYAVIDGLEAKIYKENKDAPLNIAGIIERLKKDKPKKKSSFFEFKLNNLDIINSQLHYDVLSEPQTPNRFNANHVHLSDLDVIIYAPILSTDLYDLRLDRLSFAEASGLTLKKLSADVRLASDSIRVQNLMVQLPGSDIRLGEIANHIDGFADLASLGTKRPVDISIIDGSHVYLPDLRAFAPSLGDIKVDADIDMGASGIIDSLAIDHLAVGNKPLGTNVNLSGKIFGLTDPRQASVDGLSIAANVNAANAFGALPPSLLNLSPKVTHIIDNLGVAAIDGSVNGGMGEGTCDLTITTDMGSATVQGKYRRGNGDAWHIDANTQVADIDLGSLIDNPQFGLATADASANGLVSKGRFIGSASAKIDEIEFKGYNYHDISADITVNDSISNLQMAALDPNLEMQLTAMDKRGKNGRHYLGAYCQLRRADLDTLNLYKRFPGHALSARVNIQGDATSVNDFNGELTLNNIRYLNKDYKGLSVDKIYINAINTGEQGSVNISSDFLNGTVKGRYDLNTIASVITTVYKEVFPTFDGMLDPTGDLGVALPQLGDGNDFDFNFVVAKAKNIMDFFKMPIAVIDPVSLSGTISEPEHLLQATIDAPWLLQGAKNIIENTRLDLMLNGITRTADVYATTHYPTKKGPMDLVLTIDGSDSKLVTNVDWKLIRDIPINGNFKFNTRTYKNLEGKFVTEVVFNPGQINFGNDLWNIKPSTITYCDKHLTVDNFAMQAETQSILINGNASESPYDVLNVKLDKIRLLDIFETLEIDKALICGQATGLIKASKLFSGRPDIVSQSFFVKDIGYNRCVLGDADIQLGFDNDLQAFYFDADVKEQYGRMSKIVGTITPATEELDFHFDADHVRVGFMKPFMEAFCSSIDGYASGKAHLFGSFKYIDLDGDIYADSLKIKIDFTNTWYTASDSIHIEPGLIDLKNITIRDENGHTALLNGYVKHTFFKEPVFDFSVTEARNFLSYDVSKKESPIWYGKIYGNGSAYVNGKPGEVNINVAMTTTQNSTFTFELSDAQEAEEYQFITFRDATPIEVKEAYYTIKPVESETTKYVEAIKELEKEEYPTAYNMVIQVDITPQCQVVIVMDPVGGDRIQAYGTGQMRLTYGSANDDLALFGKYTLERGDYNFTLQDIIVREFKIKEGSNIAFNGDPYNAQLDIEATYQVNANLSDLDESFLQDKDLNRTNVPVNALMKVTGDMTQPDIAFDLEFPTLQQDTYRKVKSIVSTEDMMNRQIIYLLTLHRFYTPDYMASTTKGNELFSVASSTISSQLSSMLGKLSENWSIAPNLRSDRGDFSDVEVDVALSSSLLNNRLLFNGNFGYRDKSLNTNQFIGDFDIEYLLNRKGSLRLKAYNRYNDQNYYLRSAQTTQGVGIMLRKDFDNLFRFRRNKKADQPTDSIKP